MYWNYRVCTYKVDNVSYYGITEVFYNKKGEIKSFVDPLEIKLLQRNEDFEELKKTSNSIQEAFKKPIVNLDEIILGKNPFGKVDRKNVVSRHAILKVLEDCKEDVIPDVFEDRKSF